VPHESSDYGQAAQGFDSSRTLLALRMAGPVMSAGNTFWHVSFYNDHVTVTVNVPAANADEAITIAESLIRDECDLDVSTWMIGDTEDSTVPA
jgi:hypothetical protein